MHAPAIVHPLPPASAPLSVYGTHQFTGHAYVKTANVNLIRSMLKRHRTFGYLVASYCCGIVAGIAPLWENQGSEEVAAGLDVIWKDPASRPGILFSDFACRRRRHLLRYPDPTWNETRNFVDRSVVVPYGIFFNLNKVSHHTTIVVITNGPNEKRLLV